MIGQGLIQAVRIATAGSYLAADAALAATSLVLESVLDFSTDGGQLTLNGVTYTYTAANYDTGTLTLSTGLTGPALTVDRVDVSPLSTEKLALVTTAGPGDAVSARIPHALVDRVPEGIREPGDEESVQYSLDNGEFIITDVVGREPVIEAQYLDPALTEALAANEAALEELNTVTLPALQTDLDAAEAEVAAAQADITTLTGTTIPGLSADIAAAQADVDAILPITTTDISDDAITTPKINAGAITAVKIAADTITASQIAASAITASELAANAVTAGKIAAGTIVAADIASGTITATQIAAGTITAAKIAAGTITSTEIQAGAITATQLSATAIDGKTITGAMFRTAATGQRLEIAPSASLTRLRGFTGDASETNPGSVDFGSNNGTSVVSPNFGAGEARIDMFPDTGPGFTPKVAISTPFGGDFVLTNADATIGGDVIVTEDASQTLTNKDLTASTNTYPGRMLTQVLSAAMTGATAVAATTTEADIVGATVTFTTTKANARYAASASFYYGANTGGTGIATGKLNIDGTNQAAQANFTGATTPDRANVAQSWTGTLASAGSHTFKLRQILSGTGDFRVNPVHTALTIQIFE